MLITKLDELIRSVCNIDGLSIGMDNDKSTWIISFAPNATQQQMEDAQAVIDNFDIEAYRQDELLKAQRVVVDRIEFQNAKSNPAIIQIINMNPVQALSFARENFPSLTVAEQDIIATIMNMASMAMRPNFRYL